MNSTNSLDPVKHSKSNHREYFQSPSQTGKSTCDPSSNGKFQGEYGQ